jgi:hypothetical protein
MLSSRSTSSLTSSPTAFTTWANTMTTAVSQTQIPSLSPKSIVSSNRPTQAPTQPGPHSPQPSPGSEFSAFGAIVGGIVGGLVGVTLICMVAFNAARSYRSQMNSITAGPDIEAVAPDAGGQSFTSTFTGTVEAPIPPAHRPDATSPATSITNNNGSLFVPPPTLPSAVGRLTVLTQPPGSRGEGPGSFYSTVVTPYATSRRQESTYQPFPSQENPVSLPPLNVGNSRQDIESGGRMYSRSDVAGSWTSGEGITAPPSYRT